LNIPVPTAPTCETEEQTLGIESRKKAITPNMRVKIKILNLNRRVFQTGYARQEGQLKSTARQQTAPHESAPGDSTIAQPASVFAK
jgi:hypothetical protein